MKKKIRSILKREKHAGKIEFRLFEIATLITLAVFIFWAIYGFIVGYQWLVQSIYVSGSFIYAVIYVAHRKGFSFRFLTLLYYYLALSMIAIAWLPSGGLVGAISTFLVLLYLSGLMVLLPRDYLVFVLATTFVVVGFSVLELSGVAVAAPYNSKQFLLQDLFIACSLMFIISGLCVYYFKKAYLNDRERLKETNEALLEEKIKAQSADKAKTSFLTTISHEMRTPLNGIVGVTELLSKTKLDQEQRDFLSNLSYSSAVLYSLISDVLDLTAIEAGKLELNFAPVNLRYELTELFKIFETKVRSQGDNIDLTWHVDDKIPQTLECDISRLRQVLINLVNNAIKFTKEGAVQIVVRKIGEQSESIEVEFEVSDTGIGIEPDKQHKLFDKFYKASGDASIEGSGLGLSIVKKLVALMGGKIAFSSEYGVGSRFFFVLRLNPVDIPNAELGSQAHSSIVQPDSFKWNELKVLIAEDVKVNQVVAMKILKGFGVENIDIVPDGEQAVLSAQQNEYDLILMDMQMPVKNGVEATKEICAHFDEKGSGGPVILALTANALKQDYLDCLNAGMKDVIVKPFNSMILKETIAKHCSV